MPKFRAESSRLPAGLPVHPEVAAVAGVPETEPTESGLQPPGRRHLVVVTTRGLTAADSAPAGAILFTRFWHPRDRRWSENYFESLEHALRLFVDESGWRLSQQQQLDGAEAWELIFEAREEDFRGPSTADLLADVGLSPDDVGNLLAKVDQRKSSS